MTFLRKLRAVFIDGLVLTTKLAVDAQPIVVVLDPSIAAAFQGATVVATLIEGQLHLVVKKP